MSHVNTAPWARAWANEQQITKRTPLRLRLDPFERMIVYALAIGLIFLVGLQLGLKEGKADGYKLGRADTWATHYEQFAKVQWVFDDADLGRMYEKR